MIRPLVILLGWFTFCVAFGFYAIRAAVRIAAYLEKLLPAAVLILATAAAAGAQNSFVFVGAYFTTTFQRVGFPTLPLDNVVRKRPPATGQIKGYVPAFPTLAPSPAGFIMRSVPRSRPPACPVTDIRVYLSSGNRPNFLGVYNPAGTPYFVPAAATVRPLRVNVLCFSATLTDSALNPL